MANQKQALDSAMSDQNGKLVLRIEDEQVLTWYSVPELQEYLKFDSTKEPDYLIFKKYGI